MAQDIYDNLLKRIGKDHLGKRLTRQVNLAANFYAKNSPAPFHFENVQWIHVLLKILLHLTGLYEKGVKNALDYKVERIQVPVKNLPTPFNHFKILQISDIHADALVDEGNRLETLLADISAEFCIFTGDFRFRTQDVHEKALLITKKIGHALGDTCPKFGILGNHDFIEFVPGLESAGIQMLLNEAVPIRKNGTEIWLAGIDDAHLYGCHDISKAFENIPPGAVKILLSHTPETYAQASMAGVDYLLCGHTHGGQICLPGGIPIMTNAKCPRAFCSGSWRFGDMRGYTSRGTGSSGLPVRFFCPPEITVHELVCAGTEISL